MNPLYLLLKQFPKGVTDQGWNIKLLCMNPQFPWQYVREHPEGIYSMINGELKLVEWDWFYLSRCDNLDWQLVREFPDKPWSWQYLSCRRGLNFQLVREFPDKPWNWDSLSGHRDLDWQLVREFPDWPWNWQYLSKREDLDWQLVMDFPDKPWNRDRIRMADINQVLCNPDSYSVDQLSSLIYEGQLSGLMTKSARRDD